jgi:hypothetical protein
MLLCRFSTVKIMCFIIYLFKYWKKPFGLQFYKFTESLKQSGNMLECEYDFKSKSSNKFKMAKLKLILP